MIDLLYAKKNYKKYKFDYNGYLVIIDEIRTRDILESNDFDKIKKHYLYLKKKYKNEIELIKRNYNERIILSRSINNKEQVKEGLLDFIQILPAITFIVLGLEKEIGISS